MVESLFDCCDYNNRSKFYNTFYESKKIKYEAEDCIVKVGNKWKIRGNNVKYWDADFDTKKDAQAALRAYWANKKESKLKNNNKINENKEISLDLSSYVFSITIKELSFYKSIPFDEKKIEQSLKIIPEWISQEFVDKGIERVDNNYTITLGLKSEENKELVVSYILHVIGDVYYNNKYKFNKELNFNYEAKFKLYYEDKIDVLKDDFDDYESNFLYETIERLFNNNCIDTSIEIND